MESSWGRAVWRSFASGAWLAIAGCAAVPQPEPRYERFQDQALSQQITGQLMAQSRYFESCRQVYADEGLKGTLIVRFRVRANGRASRPHVFESIGQSHALDRCLAEATQRLRFEGLPAGVVADVDYPMVFQNASPERLPAGAF